MKYLTIKWQFVAFFSCAFLFLCLCIITYFLLQYPWFYDNTIGIIEKSNPSFKDFLFNYFEPANQFIFNQWDSNFYLSIANNGYVMPREYAFFPVYPWIIKLFGTNLMVQSFVNYFFFAIGLFLILKTRQDFVWTLFNIVVIFSAPFLVVFFIPYSESSMVLIFAIGWYLKQKLNNKLYILFFIFAGGIRASNLFFLAVSGVCVLFILLLQKETNVKKIFSKYDWILYMGIGVFCAALYQVLDGAENLFSFLDAQKYWGKAFSLPHTIGCWSKESLMMNFFVFFVFTPILVHKLLSTKRTDILSFTDKTANDFVFIFYFICLSLLVYFTQQGSLHGLFRYLLCTPFFYIIQLKNIASRKLYIILIFFSFIFINSNEYVLGQYQMESFGFFLLILYTYFVIFNPINENKFIQISRWLLVVLLFIFNVLFTSYLMYKFLGHGRLFL